MARHGLLTQQPGAASGGAPAPAPGPAQGAPAPVGGAAAPAQGGGGEQPNVSPAEQQIYEQFVNNAFSAIYDEKSLPSIIESLKGDGNPVEGLANTAVGVVVRVQDSAEQSGQALGEEVVFSAGTEILEDLASLSEKAGIHEFTPEELEAAMFQAMDRYRELKGGSDGAAFQGAKEDFNKIVEIDKAGRLDEAVPGLRDKFGGGAAPAGRPGAGAR